MESDEFLDCYFRVLGSVIEGRLVTIIPFAGDLDWREYDLDEENTERLLAWPDCERVIFYSELLVSRGRQIERGAERS